MDARYSVRAGIGNWVVWDAMERQALAVFDSVADAETCRAACELAHRDAHVEDAASDQPPDEWDDPPDE